jgi:large subunit ribosomal protein L9
MEIILLEDVPHLGSMGEIVEVKPGYGRNYLIPQGLAEIATRGNKAHMEHQLDVIRQRREQLKESAQEKGQAIDGLSITLARRAGEDGRLFGSVTNRDIEDALASMDLEVERRRIMLPDTVKQLGIYKVPIKLHADVTADLFVWVAAI